MEYRQETENTSAHVSRLGEWLLTSKLVGIVEIVLVFAGAFATLGLVQWLLGKTPNSGHIAATAGILAMLALVLAGLKLRGQGWDHFGLTFKRTAPRQFLKVVLQSVPTFGVAVLAFVVVATVIGLFVGKPEQADYSSYAYLQGKPWLLFGSVMTAWFTASFSEEVLYRGFLITRLAELGGNNRRAVVLAVLISSMLFGLAHIAWGPAGMVQTFAMGLALAIAYLKFGRNLWVTILAHGYMDTALFVSIYISLGQP